jgi:hypothetical protein
MIRNRRIPLARLTFAEAFNAMRDHGRIGHLAETYEAGPAELIHRVMELYEERAAMPDRHPARCVLDSDLDAMRRALQAGADVAVSPYRRISRN